MTRVKMQFKNVYKNNELRNRANGDDDEQGSSSDYCPYRITRKSYGELEIPLNDVIQDTRYYTPILSELRGLSEEDDVFVHLETPGGVIDAALALIDGLNTTQANVHIHISNRVASAGTLIALGVPSANITISPNASFMFHNAQAWFGGDIKQIADHFDFEKKKLNKLLKDYYSDFLTLEELEKIMNSREVWLGTEEIKERFTKLKQIQYERYSKPQVEESVKNEKSESKPKRTVKTSSKK
jgi:ATP-dependent Clp protease, protease subunit